MKPRVIGYLVTTTLVTLAFVGSGIANLLRAEHVLGDMMRLGYPVYFMTILGTWKVLGALTIAAPRLPRLKEWAYAGILFDLTGAALSRAASGDGPEHIAPPLMIAAMALVSWSLRPEGRRLPDVSRGAGTHP